MSYDFDTTLQPCDHFQTRERMVVDQYDLRTLLYANDLTYRMRGSVANSNLVKLYIHDQEIPKGHPIYGWDLMVDELNVSSDDEQRRKIVFRKPCRIRNLFIEIDYNVIPPHCLKCQGYGKTNDFHVNNSRSFLHITEHPKLLQRILKHLLTSVCNFYPKFTSPLREWIGKKLGMVITNEDINQEVVLSLSHMRDIQQTQKTVQTLVPQEVLRDIESVIVQASPEDPCKVKVKVSVSSYGNERPQPLSFSLRSNR